VTRLRRARAANRGLRASRLGQRELATLGATVRVHWPKKQVFEMSGAELSEKVAHLFGELFPLVLLAIEEDPLPAIREYLHEAPVGPPTPPPPPPPPPTIQPEYTLATCSAETDSMCRRSKAGSAPSTARPGHHLRGPPGTGKTFMAEKLAAHLIGGG